MAYDLNKRLFELQEKSSDDKYRTTNSWKAFLIASLILYGCIYLFSIPEKTLNSHAVETLTTNKNFQFSQNKIINVSNDLILLKNNQNGYIWLTKLKTQIHQRLKFLNWFLGFSTLPNKYYSFAKSLVINFNLPTTPLDYHQLALEHPEFDPFTARLDLSNMNLGFSAFFTETVLLLVFVLFTFLPLWLIAAGLGFYSIRYLNKRKVFDPILTICDRKRSPFYSGIYGSLRINGKISGIELSSIGLACPQMEKTEITLAHGIVTTLKRFSAFCNTTLDLTRIILAYKDFPCYVEEERPTDLNDQDKTIKQLEFDPNLGLVSNEDGTIESRAQEVLPALLLVHKTLVLYFKDNPDILTAEGDCFQKFKNDLKNLCENYPNLAKTIINLLTPNRAQAFSQLTVQEVATAYLALEAGKCMVYKKAERGYLKLSQFPHLQARAVLHSIRAYHEEFDGDSRLIIRQAIVCSRRHRDFGRSFLPEKMPAQSKALRDILEVLYIDKDKLKDSSLITELDSYLDEVLHNWQNNFLALVKTEPNNSEETSFNSDLGIVHKSIVLLKQEKILELALKGYAKPRLERIHRLMKHAQKFNTSLAISAQLPGFKRQLENENEIVDERNKSHNWDLVKKMLTRYNWLSTRLNDDAVPASGLIYGIVLDRRLEQTKTLEFETLVPLRQRRLKDLFGENWERKYYKSNPHPNDILTFVDRAGFEARLKVMNN